MDASISGQAASGLCGDIEDFGAQGHCMENDDALCEGSAMRTGTALNSQLRDKHCMDFSDAHRAVHGCPPASYQLPLLRAQGLDLAPLSMSGLSADETRHWQMKSLMSRRLQNRGLAQSKPV
ncbi:hypothetical protein NDU88_004377 [Pleurodeles waltl]|uniref:Uncharacterized protein n=1 Tax=Pleurodeles waltl TaxID=8319 RepID=A0AAV7PFK5_PLEWA|nr:hypothetical protein NDU88_004377 [Pleurodeles waltl]